MFWLLKQSLRQKKINNVSVVFFACRHYVGCTWSETHPTWIGSSVHSADLFWDGCWGDWRCCGVRKQNRRSPAHSQSAFDAHSDVCWQAKLWPPQRGDDTIESLLKPRVIICWPSWYDILARFLRFGSQHLVQQLMPCMLRPDSNVFISQSISLTVLAWCFYHHSCTGATALAVCNDKDVDTQPLVEAVSQSLQQAQTVSHHSPTFYGTTLLGFDSDSKWIVFFLDIDCWAIRGQRFRSTHFGPPILQHGHNCANRIPVDDWYRSMFNHQCRNFEDYLWVGDGTLWP